MAKHLTFLYDRLGDVLHIDRVEPYAEQMSQELDDYVVARLNPDTGEIENLEVFGWSSRLARGPLQLPVVAELRRPGQ
jgi:hypothetical protein